MGKANISFPQGMLEDVDRRAEARGETRSAFIQEATAAYMAQLDEVAVRTERAERVTSAMQRMGAIGRRMPPGPDGVDLVRQMRDEAPCWLNEAGRDDE